MVDPGADFGAPRVCMAQAELLHTEAHGCTSEEGTPKGITAQARPPCQEQEGAVDVEMKTLTDS